MKQAVEFIELQILKITAVDLIREAIEQKYNLNDRTQKFHEYKEENE